MESLELALEVVFPMILMMLVGYLLRAGKIVKQDVFRNANILLFRCFLPFMLFVNIYESNLQSFSMGALLLFLSLGNVTASLLMMWMVPHFTPSNPRRGSIVQGLIRGNVAMYGVIVGTALLGEGNMGAVSIAIGALIPITNIMSVITLDVFSGDQGRTSFKTVLADVAKNPLIIAVLLGLLANFLRVSLPEIVYSPIKQLSKVASPLSFVALGGSFTFTSAHNNRKALALVTAGRLVILPLVMIMLAALLGFRGAEMVAVLIAFAVPTAVSSAPMAQEMGADADLANEIVVFTSAFSIITIFLWVYLLNAMGLL